MKFSIFFIFMLMIFMGACTQKRSCSEKINLRADVENVLDAYIREHPQFNTFILESTQGFEQNDSIAVKHGFLLGPGYESLVKKHYTTLFFEVSNKRVFYLSSLDELIEESNNKWFIKNKPDSMAIDKDWTIKESWELFMHRSIYFYYNELGQVEINSRPDTIFLPRMLTETVRFGNVK